MASQTGCLTAWLTGCRAKKTDGPDIHLGTSLDQIIAVESANLTKFQILSQSGVAALAQANQSNGVLLKLIG